jgi:hypothetical protein
LFSGDGAGHVFGRTAVAAALGGTASAAVGGKFANGAVTASFSHLFNYEAHREPSEPEPVLVGEVNGRGDSLTFDAGPEIRIEAYSHTQGADMFTYTVDYHAYGRDGVLIPNMTPLNSAGTPKPLFAGSVVTGFGDGFPDQTFRALGVSGISYSGKVQWTVSIPQQKVTHQNSAGWNLRVYEVR